MDYTEIALSDRDGIQVLTLDRPDQLNAFTPTMAGELEHAFRAASVDDAVRAVVVTGAGRAFCAGMDLSADGNVFGLDETLRPDLDGLRKGFESPRMRLGVRDTGGRVTLAIHECTKPVIGAVNGSAVGIGATMTLAMDVRLASDRARIGFVFGKLGIVNEACSSWFLPRIVGIPQALEWLYSADILTAEQAHAGGLVSRVLPAEELLDAAVALADSFTRDRSPVATALMRQMVYRNSGLPGPLEAHLIESLAMFYTSIGDGKEGVQAFRDKRTPEFTATTSKDMPPFYPW